MHVDTVPQWHKYRAFEISIKCKNKERCMLTLTGTIENKHQM